MERYDSICPGRHEYVRDSSCHCYMLLGTSSRQLMTTGSYRGCFQPSDFGWAPPADTLFPTRWYQHAKALTATLGPHLWCGYIPTAFKRLRNKPVEAGVTDSACSGGGRWEKGRGCPNSYAHSFIQQQILLPSLPRSTQRSSGHWETGVSSVHRVLPHWPSTLVGEETVKSEQVDDTWCLSGDECCGEQQSRQRDGQGLGRAQPFSCLPVLSPGWGRDDFLLFLTPSSATHQPLLRLCLCGLFSKWDGELV